LVRVLAQALPDLVLTVLKERGIMPASLAYNLSADPRIATRAMAVVLVAVGMTLASSTRMPTYEASAQMLVDQKQSDR
jgi:hypothetical protein